MIKLNYDKTSARPYTDALFNYFEEIGEDVNDYKMNIFYWLNDDDVKRWAEVNVDITFSNDEDDEE